MKQTPRMIEKRDKLRKYIMFLRLFARPDPKKDRQNLSTNLYGKLSGHKINGERNADLTLCQKIEVRDKLKGLRNDIDDYLKEIDNGKD